MSGTASVSHADVLAGWLHRTPSRPRVRGHRPVTMVGRLRFAFYGRISTREYQDAVSSQAWQLDSATQTIAGQGQIVATYFDIGCSRRLPWTQRPRAAALLAAITSPNRAFDAVVVGEYERAFHGDQLTHLVTVLAAHGVHLWLPETNGPIDLANPTHQALIMLLGHQSNREILRARFRTTMAMRAQARDQNRHLGGRPPYGYRLIDAGPHPNPTHAAWGRRLHRLDPDPITAPHVQWIFAQRLAGHSAAAIARNLNDRGIPCPSSHDPARNPHRHRHTWTLRTVTELLANPRYTGRQVWNRYHTDHHETIPGDKRTGRPQRHQPNPKDQWIISTRPAHPDLVSERDFIAAQHVTAIPTPRDSSTRTYLLAGLIICGICGRRADSHWAHHRPAYRCRHGHTSADPPSRGRPKNLYIREDRVLAAIQTQLNPAALPWTAAPTAQHLAAYLRAHRMTIICDQNTITIGGTIPEAETLLEWAA